MTTTIKSRLEQDEHIRLSPYAAFSDKTTGRQKPIKPCLIRTEYQRDRDRILHSKAFRRLKHKTQMFLSPEGDHYRTRLTHTLEVSQIARTITRALMLNEDLAEAIALGHDLGHTPFGHMGERTLDRLMRENGGSFTHNEQSLRVVEKLENGVGLNLTHEVCDGILRHSGSEDPATLEGRCVHLSDRIAYINHDIDDALRAGILKITDLPKKSVEYLGSTHGERIDTLINDVVNFSIGQDFIGMSEHCYESMDTLRDFLMDNVYKGDWAKSQEERADRLLSRLFAYYLENPENLPIEYQVTAKTESKAQAACDYIATMTDRYAFKVFKDIHVPMVDF